MLAVAIAAATLAAFLLSSAFYAVVPRDGSAEPASAERPRPWQIAVELLRSAIVSGLVLGLLLAAEWGGAAEGALLGLALWALPVVLLAGSVVWEDASVRSAAAHAGDWLLKLVAVGAILGMFA